MRDYIGKNGFSSVVLGLSGGIDSAVVATIACDALGPDNVHVVGMPSDWSSEGSITDAKELAALQGLQWQLIPIAPMVDAYRSSLPLDGLALENLQARVRGTLLMAISNQHGHLVLTTGNKSELATGFSTLYGDSAGAFAPIKDVPKSLVWKLARWRNTQSSVIPEASIDKPPSAELAPGQLDSDRLPPYEVLDALLESYVGKDLGRAELIAAGFDAADGRPGRADGRPGGVQAAAEPTWPEDHVARLWPRPEAADHLEVARGPAFFFLMGRVRA